MLKKPGYGPALMAFIFLWACNTPPQQTKRFQEYLQTIPEIELPFKTNSNIELGARAKYDTAFREFNPMQMPVYGKTRVNDSTFAILFLAAGDAVYPNLVTYTAQGKQIDSKLLLHLPGGSNGYLKNGVSYLRFDKNFQITITDSIQTFTRDSLENIIPRLTVKSAEITRYRIMPDGRIKEPGS